MADHHFIVNLIIRKDNMILLERRHDSGKDWKFPGGHVEKNENLFSAVKREINEELGINIELFSKEKLPQDIPDKLLFFPNPVRTYIEFKDKDSGLNIPHTHTGFVFFATTNEEPEPIEKQEIKWFTKKELSDEKNILNEVKYLSLKALQK